MQRSILVSLFLLALSAHAASYRSYNGKELKRYTKLNASEKQQFIWKEVLRTKYKGKLPTALPLKEGFRLLNINPFKNYYKPTFLHKSDFMLKGRKKLIHTYGAVAKVELAIDKKARGLYTGLLSSGALGVARMGVALDAKMKYLNLNNFLSFTPGMGLKFFVDNNKSENLLVMNALDGQGQNYNPFAKSFTNAPKGPTLKSPHLIPLKMAFNAALKRIDRNTNSLRLPLENLCRIERDGTKIAIAKNRCPKKILLIPVRGTKRMISKGDKRDIRVKLKTVPAGTVLYTIFAEKENGGIIRIGQLKTLSDFVSSKFGDQNLFFKHSLSTEK